MPVPEWLKINDARVKFICDYLGVEYQEATYGGWGYSFWKKATIESGNPYSFEELNNSKCWGESSSGERTFACDTTPVCMCRHKLVIEPDGDIESTYICTQSAYKQETPSDRPSDESRLRFLCCLRRWGIYSIEWKCTRKSYFKEQMHECENSAAALGQSASKIAEIVEKRGRDEVEACGKTKTLEQEIEIDKTRAKIMIAALGGEVSEDFALKHKEEINALKSALLLIAE